MKISLALLVAALGLSFSGVEASDKGGKNAGARTLDVAQPGDRAKTS